MIDDPHEPEHKPEAGSDESDPGDDYLQEEELRPGFWLLDVCRDLFPGSTFTFPGASDPPANEAPRPAC